MHPIGLNRSRGVTVHGRLESDTNTRFHELRVVLQSTGMSRESFTAFPSPSGRFMITDVPPGSYHLMVLNPRGVSVHSELLAVDGFAGQRTIRLKALPGDRPARETISLTRLQHKVPKPARKAYRKALKVGRQGNLSSAIGHLRQAVKEDPEYFEASLQLGFCLSESGAPEESLVHFSRASRLDPHSAEAYAGAATALARLQRFAEAEIAARAAATTGRNLPIANYILGLSLIHTGRYTKEAVDNLRLAADRYPMARLAAAQVLEHNGDIDGTKTELRLYLENGQETYRSQVQAWLKQLGGTPTAGELARAPAIE